MLTFCPFKDCAHVWRQDEIRDGFHRHSNGYIRGECHQCGRKITMKPHEFIAQMERKVAYLTGQDCLSGGPWKDPAGGEIAASAEAGSEPREPAQLSVCLDDIRSLHNVGSIFRTADAFGFGEIHLCGITGTPDRRDVKKTSLTAETNINWFYHFNALEAVLGLKQRGVKIAALEHSEGSLDIANLTETMIGGAPLCLVLGNEVSGVSEEILALSDLICHIKMHGVKESLNVSVAFGIAAYCIARATNKYEVTQT
jgi:tRNA(Leu) C34 or U34 (ribose-2'-O)-methylase TrmL